MSNENNTNNPRPLTDAEKAKQAAALAASKGADQPKPLKTVEAALADVKVTVEHKPTGDAPKVPHGLPREATGDAVSKAIDTLLNASTTVPANALIEGKGKPAVLADLTRPSKAPTSDQYVAGLELTADTAHNAAIDRANANVGKAQGGTVKAKGGKGGKTPTVAPVTAAKPVKLTAREMAAADSKNTRGYDFSRCPRQLADMLPTVDVIDGVRATNVLKTLQTKTELALCVYAMPNAQRRNVYDIATLLQAVCGGSHDHKMNTVNQKAVPSGMWLRLNPGARAIGLTDGKNLIAYGVGPSPAGLKKIRAALGDRTPGHWLPEPSKPADKGKGNPASGSPATA